LFEYRFARALEDLGHIEVSRDESLRSTRWEATDPCLAQLANERDFMVVGAIGRRSLAQLEALVVAADGEVRTDVDDLGLPRRVVGGVGPATLEHICRSVGAPYGGSLRLSLAPAQRLATLLPAMSSLIGSIEARRPPGHRATEIYDVALAAWRPAERIEAPGGYRLQGYGMSYAMRLTDDPPGTVRIVDARLVRYGAALLAGETLIDYDPDRRSLEVPLGAALPGLYGRSAVLAGGWLPRRSQDGRALVYQDVPADIASALMGRLST
jgi:hypothetical protein